MPEIIRPVRPPVPALERSGETALLIDPFENRPPDHTPLDEIFSASVAPAATVTLIDVEIEANEMFRLLGLGQNVGAAGWSDCVWSLTVNGIRDPNYGRIVDQVGIIAEPGNVHVRVIGPSRLVFRVTNNGVAAYVCAARMVGYAFPAVEWTRFLKARGQA